MKKCMLFSLLVILAAANTGLKGIEMNRPGLTVKETFDIYVKAVQNSDIEALFTTVTDNDDFFFLTRSFYSIR